MKKKTTKRIGTVLVRVPRDVDNILRSKLPDYPASVRWRMVYDTSAIKVDQWLGKPIKIKKK